MPRPGFYNDNEYRAYPFIFKVGQSNFLPNSAVVDCGIIMGLDSEFDAQIHSVWLAVVRRVGPVFEFELQTDAPGAADFPLVFTRAVTADEWQTEHLESAPYVKDENSCAVEPAWSGFLVTGPLVALTELLPANGSLTLVKNFVVEHARIQSLVKSYLRTITLGNMRRPQAKSACDPPDETPRPVIINARCLTGDIRFREGYNAIVYQRDASNEISIGASFGAGARNDAALCENGSEIPFYENEQPPVIKPATETEPEVRSAFYSGGPTCDELISSVNGVQGPDLTIAGGSGVDVKIDETNPNTIKITLSDTTITGNC